MLKIFMLTLLIISLSLLGMALGVILRRPPLKGSCGGPGRAEGNGDCPICSGGECENPEGDSANAAIR